MPTNDVDYLDLFNKHIICEKCEKDLPNKKYITENGCLWCTPKEETKKDGKTAPYMGKTDKQRCKEIFTDIVFGKEEK